MTKTKTRRILLVDDDHTLCLTLAGALRRRGCAVMVAHNVEEGIEEAEAWQPTDAIVDLRMPGPPGLSLVSHLKQRFDDIAIIVLTGFGSIQTAVTATKLGAAQYLTKPVGADDILRALDGLEPATDRAPTLPAVEWEHIQRVLSDCDGNISEAARRLNMHRRSLQRKLARGPQSAKRERK